MTSSELETKVISSEIEANDVAVEKKENPEKVKVLEKEGSLWNFSCGLLNENDLGSISGILIPQSGHAKFSLKLSSFPPTTSTIKRPPESLITVSMESVRRFSTPSFH